MTKADAALKYCDFYDNFRNVKQAMNDGNSSQVLLTRETNRLFSMRDD
jgi:hypothetical protein